MQSEKYYEPGLNWTGFTRTGEVAAYNNTVPISAGAENIGYSAISQAVGGAINQLFAGIDARRNWKYQKKAMTLQQQLILEQMAKQYEYQRQVFDYTNEYNTPAAVIARYRAAGINPTALFGQSGSMTPTLSGSGNFSGHSPSGGSGYGATTQSPLMYNDPATASLASSQASKNMAEADYYRNAADNQAAQALTEGSYKTLLESKVGLTNAETFLQQQRGIIESYVAAKGSEFADAQLLNLQAQTAQMIASAQLSDEERKLVINQTAHELLRAGLTKLQHAYTRAQADYVATMARDAKNHIRAAMESHVLTLQDPKTGEITTKTVNAYEASAYIKAMGALSAYYQAAIDQVNADWANPEKWNNSIMSWVNGAADLSSIFFGFSHAKAARSIAGSQRIRAAAEHSRAMSYERFVDTRSDWSNAQIRRGLSDYHRGPYNFDNRR